MVGTDVGQRLTVVGTDVGQRLTVRTELCTQRSRDPIRAVHP